MLKTVRFTSKFHNTEKFNIIKDIDNKVLVLKNEISEYIYNNLDRLLTSRNELYRDYTKFKIPELGAWETQFLFQMTCKLYENQINKRKQNIDFKIQSKMKITNYKRKTKNHNVGDTKDFKLVKKWTDFSKAIKYLCFCDVKNLDKAPEFIQQLINKPYFDRIKNFALKTQQNILSNVKLITYTSGTHKKPFGSNKIYKDDTNSKYKWWYKYKIPGGAIHIPLQINKKYHKDFEKYVRFNAECYVQIIGNKINILTTREVEDIDFKHFTKVVGIDLNVKHNFCFISNGLEIDYDRKYIAEAVNELKKLDKIKKKKDIHKKRLQKICKRNEGYFKYLISNILDKLEKDKVSDIVLEDLNLAFGATYIRHPDFDIKYSRLVRLLRLSNIKTWMIEQAHKRGIRVHLTNPAYTSQTCPKCHNISRENRKTQEDFICTECGHTDNADHNSSVNILNRYCSNVLSTKLHNKNKNTLELSPKRIKRDKIKSIIQLCEPVCICSFTGECIEF